MSRVNYTLVTLDDWQALYVDGVKVMEGHRLSARDVLERLCSDFEVEFVAREATQEYRIHTEGRGYVPDKLWDYPARAFVL